MSSKNPGRLSHVSHFGFTVRDLNAASRFYHEALGFEVSYEGTIPSEFHTLHRLGPDMRMHVRILEKDGCQVELIALETPEVVASPLQPVNVQGFSIIAFRVDDLQGVLHAVVANGGEVLHDTHLREADREIIMCLDPEGNRLEMIYRPPAGGAEQPDHRHAARLATTGSSGG